MSEQRILCQFSCGAASAVATKLILAEYPAERVVIVNAFIQEEHPDNRRFLADCEKWFQHPITVLRNAKYNASTFEVYRRVRYIKGMYGAPCSKHLKRDLLNDFARPDDIYVLGYTTEEQDRIDKFLDANNGRKALFPLVEKNLGKADCLAMIERAGIKLPDMYLLGFDNANCKFCPKGGINYHMKCRKHFPSEFAELVQIQRVIGPGSYFLRYRSGPKEGERMPLWELPEGEGNMADEPSFSCSFFCEMAEQDIAGAA
jgi:hypothetical protein